MRKKSYQLSHIFIIVFLFFGTGLSAQILIQSGVDPEDMVENIVGDGVIYSNVTYTGAPIARGLFTQGSTTNLGLESGVFLTSGAGYIIPGPNEPPPNYNDCSQGSNNGTAGDAQLNALAGVSTYDAAVLEFDFIPESDTLRFKYVFGSEEYNEFVNSSYNDVFGFFVSGPNPDGGTFTNKNIAIVPGSDPEIPIAINNINDGYYSCGEITNGPCTNCEYYSDNTFGMTLEYDGFTVVLTAFLKVVACEDYHIKMAIGDAGDGVYDSGMFLEENSFESPKIDVEIEPYPDDVSEEMVEGCVDADIIFRLPNTSYAPITITYEITGSAENGVDYETIPPFITIPVGEDSAFIHVVPLWDGVEEGNEDIVIILKNELGCTIRFDTVVFYIIDYIDIETETTPPTAICEGQSIDIWCNTEYGIPPYEYQWLEPPTNEDSLTVTPEETTTYYVEVFDMCGGSTTDSVTIEVLEMPELELGNDTTLCGGDSLILSPGDFASYLWQDGSSGSTYTVTEPGTYFVQVSAVGGCSTADQIVVDFYPEINLDLGNDTIICTGETIMLEAPEGFIDYSWQDGSSGTTYEANETGNYWVTVSDEFGCSRTDSLYLAIEDGSTTLDLGDDVEICAGDTYTISPGFYNSYLWQDGSTDSSYLATEEGTYILTVLGGCNYATDSIVISYAPPILVDLGQDTSICFGATVDLDAGFGFDAYQWQDGSTDPFLNGVDESGVYWVEVTADNSCKGSDTIVVQVASIVELPSDTVFCDGETISIDAGFGFDYYNWNTGSTSQVINVTESGTYSVEVSYYYDCGSTDEIVLERLPIPYADIEDEELCIGDTVLLIAPEGEFEYMWDDGTEDTLNYFAVVSEGTYTLKMSNLCGEYNDDITVTEFQLPTVSIGEDILLFPGESQQVDAGDFVSYYWQDGTTERYYIVNFEEFDPEYDSLIVEVFDGHCKNSDGIKVEVYDVTVPNAITPNGDGYNDTFKPQVAGWSGINSHTMVVYNRWGEKVWESDDFESGWDGKSNGKYVSQGTYFWVLEVKYGNENISKTYKGSLTVIGTN
ncbi:MAG: hypothetical protein DRJ05_03465 [Bacteroidetes bacterium]|nr:MAG: hypothetical protein DRJ05_03465 [Bacteroidota bacterium]